MNAGLLYTSLIKAGADHFEVLQFLSDLPENTEQANDRKRAFLRRYLRKIVASPEQFKEATGLNISI
jgi:hypothetical protein